MARYKNRKDQPNHTCSPGISSRCTAIVSQRWDRSATQMYALLATFRLRRNKFYPFESWAF
jgi:hypothetical protein